MRACPRRLSAWFSLLTVPWAARLFPTHCAPLAKKSASTMTIQAALRENSPTIRCPGGSGRQRETGPWRNARGKVKVTAMIRQRDRLT